MESNRIESPDANEKNNLSQLLFPHGNYRKLKSFQIAQLVYDVTVRFCNRYIEKRSRTHDQMVQAARSGVQNIAEGSLASATSKKTELKLTNVARASIEELKLDYEDYLRQRALRLWEQDEPLRQELVAQRCATADELAQWIIKVENGRNGRNNQNGRPYDEISANAVLVLIGVAASLLDRQINSLAKACEKEGGFTERLYRVRSQARRNHES
jgi:four helix bundle suffix protein